MVTLNDAREVVHSLSDAKGIYSVIVFGSVARDHSGNDLDLLIIVDCPLERLELERKEINQRLKPFYSRFAVDPFIVNRDTITREETKGSIFLNAIFSEGKVMFMKDALEQWKLQAQEELKTARYLFEGKFYRSACFHAQQATEKYLKFMLLKNGWQLEKIHNVRRLISIAEQYKLETILTDDEIDFIDSIYRSRYPAEAGLLPLGEPVQEDSEKAIQIAEKIINKSVGG